MRMFRTNRRIVTMSKSLVKPGILSVKRYTPVHNLRGESCERPPTKDDVSWAAEQLRQFQIMMEIEDMENDRAAAGIFTDHSIL